MAKFKIETKSDLCVSNGESYGSVIDTDVAYDKYGIPVIKGKSLKGCLLEIAEELTDAEILSKSFIPDMFGKSGKSREGALIISDAHPVDYDKYLDDIRSMKTVPSASQVIECFSSIRGQTSICSELGRAKENSLRTIRVVNRGVNFICEYKIDEKLTNRSEYDEGLKKCIKLLRRIGMNRTRGLGEIRCTFDTSDTKSDSVQKTYSRESEIKTGTSLRYTIETVSPLMPAKENENINYVPGSAIEGLCFRRLGDDIMKNYLENGLHFTNAVLSDGVRRFTAVPAFIGKEKVPKKINDGNQCFVFDTDACSNIAMPAKALNTYISDDFSEIEAITVSTEINYHHQQSQDNPGIIDGNNFYQISSLSDGQFFTGNIYGNPEMLMKIYKAFGDESVVNIGYYRSTGYGKCRLTLIPENRELSNRKSNTIAVCLSSPAILYDDNGMPSAVPDVFIAYFEELIKKFKINIESVLYKYFRYASTGGYNVTWNLNKQRFQVYDAGTSFIFKLDKDIDIDLLSQEFIGERTSDGYGELKVYDYNDIIKASKSMSIKSVIPVYSTSSKNPSGLLTTMLEKKKTEEEIRKFAVKHAKEYKEHGINPSQLGRLALMCEEATDYNGFESIIDEIKDKERKDKDLSFIRKINPAIESYIKENQEYFKLYYRTMLITAKYLERG